MLVRILYAIGGFIETLIALRIILRLLGANAGNAIVNWIYTWSTPFVAPFSGIFGQDATVISGVGTVTASVFDWAALTVGFLDSLLGRRQVT